MLFAYNSLIFPSISDDDDREAKKCRSFSLIFPRLSVDFLLVTISGHQVVVACAMGFTFNFTD